MLLSLSCGLVGAGLISVFLNVAVLTFAVIADSLSPQADADVDMTLVGVLYVGGLFVGSVCFFALPMDPMVRWLKPKAA